jgi:hypothetical protein
MKNFLHEAAKQLGYNESFTVEQDGQMWHGTDSDRIYLTTTKKEIVETKALELQTLQNAKRQAVLEKLGLTADEAAALLG